MRRWRDGGSCPPARATAAPPPELSISAEFRAGRPRERPTWLAIGPTYALATAELGRHASAVSIVQSSSSRLIGFVRQATAPYASEPVHRSCVSAPVVR